MAVPYNQMAYLAGLFGCRRIFIDQRRPGGDPSKVPTEFFRLPYKGLELLVGRPLVLGIEDIPEQIDKYRDIYRSILWGSGDTTIQKLLPFNIAAMEYSNTEFSEGIELPLIAIVQWDGGFEKVDEKIMPDGDAKLIVTYYPLSRDMINVGGMPPLELKNRAAYGQAVLSGRLTAESIGENRFLAFRNGELVFSAPSMSELKERAEAERAKAQKGPFMYAEFTDWPAPPRIIRRPGPRIRRQPV